MLDLKKDVGVTLNLSGSLLEQLELLEGAIEFFSLTKKMMHEGKVELLNSSMYHPLLPLTPEKIWRRQVLKNKEILKRLLGVEGCSGFFPPELAIDQEHFDQLSAKYVIVHETAVKQSPIAQFHNTFLLAGKAELIEICRSFPGELKAASFLQYTAAKYPNEDLIILPNDAELFGHHYMERLTFLSQLLDSEEINCITASQAISIYGKSAKKVDTVQLSSWQNRPNLHLWTEKKLQQNLLSFARFCSELGAKSENALVQKLLDQGWSSCYLYWLSNFPWWHPDLVMSGIECLIRSVRASDLSFDQKNESELLFSQLSYQIWQYHWSAQVEIGYHQYDEVREKTLMSLPHL